MHVKKSHRTRSRIGPAAVLPGLVPVLAALLPTGPTLGEERYFIVFPAHSPKQAGTFETDIDLFGQDSVDEAYFAEDQISFKRFWEEVSYNDVTIAGTTFSFAHLPWPLEAPDDVLDEGNPNGLFVNGTVPYRDLDRSRSFNYGVGEKFYEFVQMFEVDLDGNYNGMDDSDPPQHQEDEFEGEEEDLFIKFPALEDGVWTPGERFRDSDGDGRWDRAETSPDAEGRCPFDLNGDENPLYDPNTVSLVVGTGESGEVMNGDYCDLDDDGTYDPGEPWEDFLVRYDPTEPEGSRWVPVTEEYLRKNYPGDVKGLIARMGNFTWDGPDAWIESISEPTPAQNLTPEATTKMQHAGRAISPGKATPRPPWLTAMWLDRYGTLPPAWGDVVTGEAIPELIPFDPSEPDPAIERVNPPEDETLRQFAAGIYDRDLRMTFPAYNADLVTIGENGEVNVILSPQEDDETEAGPIQPDSTGVYDGPVEFDDLASSIYHDPPDAQWRFRYTNGDLRLGEVTSPRITGTGDPNNPDDLDPVWGDDDSSNDPYVPTVGETDGDGVIWSAGPYAFRVHGNNLMDGGNQLSLELLTWRTDGQGTSVPKRGKLPLRSIWLMPNPNDPGRTYGDTYFGAGEVFDNFDAGSGYSLAEACDDPALFSVGDYGVRGLAYYNDTGTPGEGSFYMAKLGEVFGQEVSVITRIEERVIPSGENLPADCPNPVVDSRPLADTTPLEALSFELWMNGLDDIQAIEFDPDGTMYAINAETDELVIVTNPFGPAPAVEPVTLNPVGEALAAAVQNTDIHITGLAYHAANHILYGCDTGPFKMLFTIGTQGTERGDYDVAIWNTADATSGSQAHFNGNIVGLAYRPDYGGTVYPIWGIYDGGLTTNARVIQMDPDTGEVVGPLNTFGWDEHQIHDLAFDDGAAGSDYFGTDVLDAGLYRFPITGTSTPYAELTGVGICFSPQDSDGDEVWDRRDENFCDYNGNGLFDYAGFRDFNLDGLIDQGETLLPNTMNYLNDFDPSSSNDAVHGHYPFNRVRLLEDMVEVSDHERDWTDYVSGGQLPDRVYSTVLVNSVGSAFADVREHAPALRNINVRDQAEPFDNLILNDRGAVEFDGGESYTDTNGNGTYDSGESFNDDGLDGMPGTYDTGEGNGVLDGEPYQDLNGNGKWDYGSYISITDLTGPLQANYLGNARVTAHEYGHFWECYRDLYDIVAASQGSGLTGPVAAWDLMATGAMVHPSPVLKEMGGGIIQHEPWIDVIDLTGVLTPGIEQTITINTCEQSRQNAYYVYRNMDRPAERFYFWRVTNNLLMPDGGPTVNAQLPGTGLMVMHVDSTICGIGACGSGLCQQQPDPWVYKLIQADGSFDLQNGTNTGDAGDPFGQGSGVFTWTAERGDNAWNNGAITGIEITNITEFATASLVTFRWTPQDVPWFEFIRPPGGESSQEIYQIAYRSSDRFGGTLTEFYIDGPYAADDPAPSGYDGPNVRQLCATLNPDGTPDEPRNCPSGQSQIPKSPGTVESSFPVDLNELDDGDYYFYCRLIPGEGQNGNFEQAASLARPPRDADGNANTGNGWLTGTDDPNPGDGAEDITPPVVDLNQSLLETWTVACTDATNPGAEIWSLTGSLSGPQELLPTTGQVYPPPPNTGPVSFVIVAGSEDFAVGDRFIFTTTGKTAFSARLRVNNHAVSNNPTAAFTAAPLTGGAPLTVNFDASDSFDPESGGNSTLDFDWDFGDGNTGTGMIVQHTYTEPADPNDPNVGYPVTLVVTSTISGLQNFNPSQTTIIVTANEPPLPCLEDVDDAVVISGGGQISGDTSETPSGFAINVRPSICPGQDRIDPNGDPLVADWDFGDPFDDPGDPDLVDQPIDQTVSHTYRAAGTYTLALTVREDTANAAATTIFVTVSVAGNQSPVAVISADPIGGPTPLTVTFSAAGSTDDTSIATYDWDYGDGGTCSDCGSNPLDYTYMADGPAEGYTATVTVTDDLGVTDSASIQIYAGNQSPTANIVLPSSPPTVSVQDSITFKAEATDPDDDPLTYDWDFDNGDVASGSEVQYTYSSVGVYTVVLTVDDGKGGTGTDTIQVTVEQNDPPSVVLNASPTSGGPPLTVNFSAVGTSDPQTAVADLLFTWDFGDGSPPVAGYALTLLSHTYNAAAVYRATLTVSDGVLQSEASVDITVRVPAPSPPTATLTADPDSGPAPLAVTFDAGATSDPDDDLATFLWEFGDGSIARESLATVTSLTHMYSEAGTYTARLTAFDLRGQSSIAMVEVTVGEGVATGPTPTASPCGFGMFATLTLGLGGLTGLRFAGRRRRRSRC